MNNFWNGIFASPRKRRELMAIRNYVIILQEMERAVLDKCNSHRRKHDLSPLVFSENCEMEICIKDCPFLGHTKGNRSIK